MKLFSLSLRPTSIHSNPISLKSDIAETFRKAARDVLRTESNSQKVRVRPSINQSRASVQAARNDQSNCSLLMIILTAKFYGNLFFVFEYHVFLSKDDIYSFLAAVTAKVIGHLVVARSMLSKVKFIRVHAVKVIQGHICGRRAHKIGCMTMG